MARTNTLDPKAVGKRIRHRRLELGLSQRELNTDGVTYAYISRIEAGERTPSLSALVVLAERMRDRAAELVVEVEGLQADEANADYDYGPYLAMLRAAAVETTGLYLLTGTTHDTCPFCGRHEQGATHDGKPRKRKPRRR